MLTHPRAVSQSNHQEHQREVPALISAEAFRQCPIQNGQAVGRFVVQQVAGMRVGMKNHVPGGRKQGNGKKSFNQALGNPATGPYRKASHRISHFLTALLGHRRNLGATKRLNQSRDPDALLFAVERIHLE